MSDSDDDIPIALLMKKKMEAKHPGKVPAPSAPPASQPEAKKAKKRTDLKSAPEAKKPKRAAPPAPSASLSSKSKSKKKQDEEDEDAFEDEEKPPKKAARPAAAAAAPRKRASAPSSAPTASANTGGGEESIFGLERMDKHSLVTAILVRWKYCLADDWPGELKPMTESDFIPAHVAGIYVRLSDGKLIDLRNAPDGKTPSMGSLLTLKAQDLQKMLVAGLHKQLALATEDKDMRDHLKREVERAEKLKIKKIERKYQEAVAGGGGGNNNHDNDDD